MPWAKFGDGFHNDHRILELDHQAFRLYVCGHTTAMALMKEKNAPGVLTRAQAQALARHQQVSTRSITTLVDAGLWQEVDGGYRIYKFEKFLPSRRELAEDRGDPDPVKSAAGSKGAAARKQTGSKPEATLQQTCSPVPEPVPEGVNAHHSAGTVTEVWTHYREGTGRLLKRDPTPAEERRIRDVVKTFGLETVVASCYGWRYDDWDRRPYNIQPVDLFRPGNIERFAEWHLDPASRPAAKPSNGHAPQRSTAEINAHRRAVIAAESSP